MNFIEFDAQIKKISNAIIADSFKPDLIIGIARGGWMPARLLSKYLGVKKLASYGMSYKDAARTDIDIYQPVILSGQKQKILVVEDFLESGKSIKRVIDDLSINGNDIRSLAIGYLKKTVIIPTYSLGCIDEIPKFPWD